MINAPRPVAHTPAQCHGYSVDSGGRAPPPSTRNHGDYSRLKIIRSFVPSIRFFPFPCAWSVGSPVRAERTSGRTHGGHLRAPTPMFGVRIPSRRPLIPPCAVHLVSGRITWACVGGSGGHVGGCSKPTLSRAWRGDGPGCENHGF